MFQYLPPRARTLSGGLVEGSTTAHTTLHHAKSKIKGAASAPILHALLLPPQTKALDEFLIRLRVRAAQVLQMATTQTDHL